jgi:hypothetical protein
MAIDSQSLCQHTEEAIDGRYRYLVPADTRTEVATPSVHDDTEMTPHHSVTLPSHLRLHPIAARYRRATRRVRKARASRWPQLYIYQLRRASAGEADDSVTAG